MGSYEYAKAVAFYETKKSWGGATIGMETLDIVPDGIDAYACAVSEHTIDIPEGPDFLAFSNAFNQAYHDFYGKAVLSLVSFTMMTSTPLISMRSKLSVLPMRLTH